jgi:hypothetical protein
MVQINISLSTPLHRLLVKVATESGIPLSRLAADCIEIGLDEKISKANNRTTFLLIEEKRQEQQLLLQEESK